MRCLPVKDTRHFLGTFFKFFGCLAIALAKVKFVPHSTCLTEVLRQSRGNVMAWLSQHKPKSMTVESATWFQIVSAYFRFIISTSFRSFERTWSLCPKNLALHSELSAIVSLFDDQTALHMVLCLTPRLDPGHGQPLRKCCGLLCGDLCPGHRWPTFGEHLLDTFRLGPGVAGLLIGHRRVAKKKVRKRSHREPLMSASSS